jgi:cytochrome c oxidase subunit 2
VGSFLSIFSTCLFFYIVYDMLISEYYFNKNNPWKYYPDYKAVVTLPLSSDNDNTLFNGTKWSLQGFTVLTVSSSFVEFDAPEKWQMNFQDPASPVMEKIIDLHHDIQFFLIIIVIAVLWMLIRIVWLFNEGNTKTIRFAFDHHTHLELIWTIIPTIILILVAIPSFALLYAVDELHNPKITMKALGNQWYWSYEFSDYVLNGPEDSMKIDSYMVLEDDLQKGQLRLLEVDERILVPENLSVRILVTSRDVIHSWAVPSLGVKMDACPGRLNQVGMYIRRKGVYFGQCSELCGINHAFMPIVVEAVSLRDYKEWILKKSPS